MSKRGASTSDETTAAKRVATGKNDSTLPLPHWFNAARVRALNGHDTASITKSSGDCVVYWMSRDQRAECNWALLLGRHLASHWKMSFRVVFNLVPKFLEATLRQYSFMIDGLEEVEKDLMKKGIPFHLCRGDPVETLPQFVSENRVALLITDMSPLRMPMHWNKTVAGKVSIPVLQVDAHNIVPVWHASPKQEVGARTLRPKIHGVLNDFLTPFPDVQEQTGVSMPKEKINWKSVLDGLEINRDVKPVPGRKSGAAAAHQTLKEFCETRLKAFHDGRNDPTKNVASDLSPYFHFGQISVQYCINYVQNHKNAKAASDSVKSFVEEAVIRRELSDNFCFYNPKYDTIEGAAAGWAQHTLKEHETDQREHIYTLEEFEAGKTHEDLWNASQLQMVQEGKMHGFLRMYWAKKILEWSSTPAEALRIAIYLNDKYELDGRDPNGYVGCAWSICGVHDMGWAERGIFGKIRFMNYAGCKRKFDVAAFVQKYPTSKVKASTIDSMFKRQATTVQKKKM